MRRAVGAGRRLRWLLAPWAYSALTVPALAVLALTPTGHGAVKLAARLATAATTLSRHAPRAPASTAAARFLGSGSPAVGALFRVSSGSLGRHFCTASVVDSPREDLLITAAHCVSSKRPGQIAFVPGFHDGAGPYGIWYVLKVIVDARWAGGRDPNHDVAFLVVQPHDGTGVQSLTGGERLGTGWPSRVYVHVAGYPNQTNRPIVCASKTRPFGHRQMRFDCAGFTNGTSGGPFIARWSPVTGQGVVVGVIGGYEEGGDLASVSYSPRFGHAIRVLYRTAIASS